MKHALVAVLLLVGTGEARSQDYLCKNVGHQWDWFSDHAALWVEYIIVGAPGRRFEVGTGISLNGEPRGSIDAYSGEVEVTAYGLGALHIQQADDGDPFKVCASALGIGVLPILRLEFP